MRGSCTGRSRSWSIWPNARASNCARVQKYALDLTTGSSSWRVSDEDVCPALRGRQHFLPRNGQRVKEGLHWCFSIAPSSLMRARFVVRRHPNVEIILQLVDGSIDFLAERHAIELVEHGSMEPLADSVGLRALGLVLDGEIELVIVMLGVAAILGAAIRQHPTQDNAVLRAGLKNLNRTISGVSA